MLPIDGASSVTVCCSEGPSVERGITGEEGEGERGERE